MRTDYGGGPPPDAPFDLIPAVVNTYRGWHPRFVQRFRGAARAAAERAGPTAYSTAMLWRAVGLLSVTLKRQNFQVLAVCYADLPDDVQCRLGRPLSEEPEFWRAAPEEPLQWGAEEFGFPLPMTGGDTSGPGPAEEGASLGAVAEGHLRAAGRPL